MKLSVKAIIGLCLSTVFICINQNVMALPIGNARAIPSGPEYWINPCGYTWELNDPPLSDDQYANSFQLQLSQDFIYVNNWMNNFTQDKFLMSFEAKVAEDAPYRYDWLQVSSTIPKQPGQHLGDADYSQKQFNAMLIEFSNIFQRIAIGWEQVALDSDTTYGNYFSSTKNRIKNTLCELDHILKDKGLSPAPNPTRAIMPNELRNLADAAQTSQRNLRNFRILKEYVNALEYYADYFAYFDRVN